MVFSLSSSFPFVIVELGLSGYVFRGQDHIPIDDILARDTARELALKEGIFCGLSSGATAAAAIKLAERAEPGSVILAMLPDTGERYLSTFLFEGINEGSD